jgi:quinol monooxygenase YgiN
MAVRMQSLVALRAAGSISDGGRVMAQADMFGVCARMTTQPGRRDEVVDLIREFLRRDLVDGSGLIAYSVFATLEEPDTILETELWTDQAAHDTWIGTEPGRTVAQKVVALLAEPPTVWHGDVLYASGLSRTVIG